MSRQVFQNYVVRFSAGDRIFSEGDPGATMFIVQAGKVRLFSCVEENEQELAVMEKGDFFSEMSILEGLPRNNSADALEDTELIEINSTTFDKMVKGNIEIAIRLLRKLSIRLREAERRNAVLQAGGASATQAPSLPYRAPRKRAAADSGVRLVAADDEVIFALNGGETMVGRYDPVTELRPDIDLTDLDMKRSVSRRHARIVTNDSGHAIIEEVGALNGTFVNGTQLTAGEAHPLTEGDQLGFGMVKMTFRT